MWEKAQIDAASKCKVLTDQHDQGIWTSKSGHNCDIILYGRQLDHTCPQTSSRKKLFWFADMSEDSFLISWKSFLVVMVMSINMITHTCQSELVIIWDKALCYLLRIGHVQYCEKCWIDFTLTCSITSSHCDSEYLIWPTLQTSVFFSFSLLWKSKQFIKT